MACPYAFALGIPGKGIHSYRFMGFAIVDVVLTVLVAWLTSYLTNTGFWWNLLAWFVAAEVLHWYFGTPTAFLKMAGIKPSC